ncbi:hypothetical protein [Methylocapsa palsarum]|uniref:hypothetical protein n=1 Tax=Methylocapsa palsarum TaxID=1612308 RepID=UPI000B866BA5|nr:hypothetical protein [Methylocapsa palsarum]
MSVSTNRIPGDAGDESGIVVTRPAGVEAGEHFSRGLAKRIDILCQFAVFGDGLDDRAAGVARIIARFHADVVGGERENEKADQRGVVGRGLQQGPGESLGAEFRSDKRMASI